VPSAEAPDLSGTPYHLLERTAHGEFGAWRAVDEAGNRLVVKPTWTEDGVQAAELLRAEGYPAPHYVFVTEGLAVMEELPGSPLELWQPLDAASTARVVELNELQAGKRVRNAPPWPERIYDDVLRGHYHVDLELLGRHAPDLLARCRTWVEAARLDDPGDIVHWDFTTANVLASGRNITGVVDWDGACNGDRLFDLVTLFYYTRTSALREYVLARLREQIFAAYLAAIIVRHTAFALKFYAPDVGRELIADARELMG
jgi:aminoglycoside phosphotransferase (APT) family kinase protein